MWQDKNIRQNKAKFVIIVILQNISYVIVVLREIRLS